MAVAERYPQYTNGITVYSKNEKNSYCYICLNKLPIASEEHLKNSDHLSTLAYYLHNFTDNGPFVSCKLCSMSLEYSSIKEHAITHKLMPWYRPEEKSLIKSDLKEKNDESLPSSSISQVNCSPPQEVNVEEGETLTAKKKSVRTREKKEAIDTGNIVSTSFRKFRAYAERLSHVMTDKRKPSTIEEVNEPESFKVVKDSPKELKSRRFSLGGFRTAGKYVDAGKYMKQVKDQKPKGPKLRKFRDWFLGVSDKRKGELIPMTSNGINWKTNNYLALPSSSPEKYKLRNRKISLDSIAGHNDEKLNNNRELMRESVKSIYSPGDEVFMSECRICKAIILSDWTSLAKDVDSKRHEKTRVIVSYQHEPQFVLEMESKLNKNDEIKYFIADKQVEDDESVINVVEVPKGGTKDSGICFTWCSACCIKVYDDSRLNEHLKSPLHLKNSKEKFIICKSFDERDDNDDSESNEKDQHKNYSEGIMEIHGEDYFLGTICNGLKLFDEDSVFEHEKSPVHSHNLQRSLESGETEEDDVFFNEINWKTSEKSAGGEETAAQSLSPNFQSKNAGGSSSENDFFSCSSEEDSKMNGGPSEAQMVTSMARMNLNSEENEKTLQGREAPFLKESCSSLNYEQREKDSWAELCSRSDSGMRNEDVEFEDESVVSESALNLQMPENASTSQILENIRVTGDQTAASLGETYNIAGTDIWFCLACNNEKIYAPHSMMVHLTDIKHLNRIIQMFSEAPKRLNQTRFIISPEFRSEGIVDVPTKKFAICTLCRTKLHAATSVELHLSGKHHLALKKSVITRKNEGKVESIGSLSSQRSLPDGIEKFSNKNFFLCTICRKKLFNQSKIEKHVRSLKHINKGSKVIFKIGKDEFQCEICDIILSGYSDLANHLATHKINKRALRSVSSAKKSFKASAESPRKTQTLITNFQLAENHNPLKQPETYGSSRSADASEVTSNIYEDEFRCKTSDIVLSGDSDLVNHLDCSQQSVTSDLQEMDSYVFFRKLKENPQQVLNDLKSRKNIPNYIKIRLEGILKIEGITSSWCMTCNYFISEENLQHHLSGGDHREILDKYGTAQDWQTFYCELCGRNVIGERSWEAHMLGTEHKRNERQLLEASSAEASDKASVETPKRIQPMISNFKLAESDDSLEEEETSGSRKPGGSKIPQKYQPMVDCNICQCKVPGGDANIFNHRNSREHKNNEAKLFAQPIAPADTGNYVGTVSVNPRSSNANVPLDAYSQYHYGNDSSIDFIKCKVCNLNIHGIGDISANYAYALHMRLAMHKMKEMEFFRKWRASPIPSTSGSQSSAKSSKPFSKSSASGSMARFIGFSPDMYVCPICHEVVKSKKQFHSHLTSHFWRRFIKKPAPIIEEALEEPAKFEPLKCTEDSDDESVFNESPMKTLKRTRFRKRPLDVEVTGSINIYDIDKQRMSEIKAGVLLSLPKDKDTIYCLICRRNVSNNLQTFYEHLCSVKHLDYLKDMLEGDELFQNCENQLSDLALGYEYMEDISDAAVKCHACDISIENKFPKLCKHINSTNHIDKWTAIDENSRELFRGLKSKMECDFYSVRKYWCVICNLKFITEYKFQKHLIRRKHLKKIRKFSDEFLMFDYCRICASLWYGFLKTFSYHSDCRMHKYHKLDGFFSINQLPESAERLVNSAEEEIGDILRDLEFRRAIDKIKEDQLLRDLREIVVVKYPDAIAHPFGSRITGVGGKNSDLDVFLDCPTQNNCMYFGENSQPELIERRLVKIKESLENNTNIWHIDREILDCRIPIIKTKHKPTDIECDLSFTNGLTVENTALIRNYCDESADCRKLIIFIKNWMKHCELSGANSINSYGIAWLVIYFLQTKKILPTVNQLIEMHNKSQIIAGWETGVSKDFQVQTFDGSFGELLNEFFKFYGNFDYRHDVICPLLGEIVKKIDFQHRAELPSAMRPYSNYLRDTSNAEPFRVDSIMCLQDPFDLAHNITKAVKKFNIYKFKTFCCYSTKIIGNDV